MLDLWFDPGCRVTCCSQPSSVKFRFSSENRDGWEDLGSELDGLRYPWYPPLQGPDHSLPTAIGFVAQGRPTRSTTKNGR